MEKNRLFVLIGLGWLLTSFHCWSQQDHRFMVFFTDKNSSFSIDNPTEFLSQRAIDRRTRQEIPITVEDLPLNDGFISSLEGLGSIVWYETKWLNGALIQTDSSKLLEINALPFVSSMELVAPGPLLTNNLKQLQGKNQTVAGGRVQSTEIQNRILGIDHMQQEGNTGKGMLIAVFDGGFMGVDQVSAFEHLYQNDQLLTAYDYVGNSNNIYRYDDHGSKALSVIGANQPSIFTGGAFDADFILCVTEDVSSEYRVEEYNWLFAAEMADSAGVDIISTSLGYSEFDDPSMNYQIQDLDGATTAVSRAAAIAASKGILLTISAGNEGNSSWRTITAPADIDEAIVVGAIKEDSIKASFSSIGPTADGRIKPDVVALGVNTAVINRNGNVVFNNGTSFSAPQLAGLAAGVWQSNQDFNYQEVIQVIREAGHQFQNPNNQTGFGIPNYLSAKKLVVSVDSPLDDETMIQLYPNPVGDRLYLFSEAPIEAATFFIHNLSGQMVMEDKMTNIPAVTEISIDIPLLSTGVYLVTILTETGAESIRIIRE